MYLYYAVVRELPKKNRKGSRWTDGAAAAEREMHAGTPRAGSPLTNPVVRHLSQQRHCDSSAEQYERLQLASLYRRRVSRPVGVEGKVTAAWHRPGYVSACVLIRPWKQMLSSLISFPVAYPISLAPSVSLSIL